MKTTIEDVLSAILAVMVMVAVFLWVAFQVVAGLCMAALPILLVLWLLGVL